MNRTVIICLAFIFLGFSAANAPAQIGERIDRAISRIGGELRQSWDEARGAVHRMGVQGRVYSRLHWDKDLQGSTIDIDVPESDAVVLRGSVPSESAKQKAIQLARDTVGVAHVEDALAIAPPAEPSDAQRDPARR